jgi:hypothetical protein
MRRASLIILVAGVILTVCGLVAGGEHPPTARPFDMSMDVGEPSYHPVSVLRPLQTEPLLLVAEHILAQQCHNGGFGWPHDDCGETYHNLSGPILLGVLEAYYHPRDPYYLLGAVNGGAYELTAEFDNGEARFGTLTPYFLMWLARADDNTTFETFVADGLFDALASASYGPDDLDTAGWIAAIQAARSGGAINLRPWEFQTLIPTSKRLGQPGQDGLFEQATLDGLATLDNSDPANVYWDILGLAGAVRGLAFARRYTFPAVVAPLHSGVNGIDSLEGLAAYLASLQNTDGSWYWHSDLPSPEVSDEDVQTTAYAILALLEVDIMTAQSHRPFYEKGRDWLVSMVGPDGCIPGYPGGSPNTEVEGEALDAMGRVEALFFLDGFEAGTTDLWSAVVP